MSVIDSRRSLYERLPVVYRERDEKVVAPPYQLRAFLDAIDSVLVALAQRVDAQYDDLFIETCERWVIAYLADLVGTSHLDGEESTLRADVARTVKHRRRKGTLGAIESQVHALSGWAAHAIELRDRLAWNQHLDHLRPDAAGAPPFRSGIQGNIRTPVRGGTAAVRSPAWLSFVDGPFDPFARTVDVKPPLVQYEPPVARVAANLPNVGVFVWTLADYRVPVYRPGAPRPPWTQVAPVAPAGAALFAVRFEMHPQSEPMVLFNAHRYRADAQSPNLAEIDAVPGPMPIARLNSNDPAGNPEAYVRVGTYDALGAEYPAAEDVGLVLHLPDVPFAGIQWSFRGANLCAWESGLAPALRPFEIVIDPVHGRVVFGVTGATAATLAQPLADGLLVSATTGASGVKELNGSVGAQPLPRVALPVNPVETRILVDGTTTTLETALANLPARTTPLVIEITRSGPHRLDLAAVAGIGMSGGVPALLLPALPADASGCRVYPLTIRAASGERPVIRLVQPLRLRPAAFAAADPLQHTRENVRLEGLYITRDAAFGAASALIAQAVVNRLEIEGCTLDPGGARVLDGTAAGGRAPPRVSMRLAESMGISGAEKDAFGEEPEIVLFNTICGSLEVDRGYKLSLTSCIVDAGSGVADAAPSLAIRAATGVAMDEWAAPLAFKGITVFGRVRVEVARGEGAIFVHRVEVHDTQDSHSGPLHSSHGSDDPPAECLQRQDNLAQLAKGGSCIRSSYFSGDGDRLPQHVGCVVGPDPLPRFVAEVFGFPGYAQLSTGNDRRIREDGPEADEMGAFNFLRNTHKWKNIGIRLREFSPVGIRTLLIPVTAKPHELD